MKYLFIFLLITNTALNAGTELVQTAFTTSDGLIHNQITALHQEKDGYLWLGTKGGLCRFDGKNFQDMSQEENGPRGQILTLEPGPEADQLWVLSREGLYWWDAGSFSLVYETKVPRSIFLRDSRGRFWLDDTEAIICFDRSSATRSFQKSEDIRESSAIQMKEDRRGNIWIGLRQTGLIRIDTNGVLSQFGLDDGLPNRTVSHIYEAQDGVIWIATHGGLAYLHQEGWRQASFNKDLPIPIVYGIYPDRDGGLWLTLPSRLMHVKDDEVRLQEGALAGATVLRMHLDDRGNHWAFANDGIYIQGHGDWQKLTLIQDWNFITSVALDDGLMWLGTSRGLLRFERPPLETVLQDPNTFVIPGNSQSRTIIKGYDDHLWFPSLVGLGHYDGKRTRVYTVEDGLPHQVVHALYPLEDGRTWIGTDGGLALYEDGTVKLYTASGPGILGIRFIQGDAKGRLWVMDRDDVLWTWKNDRFESLGVFKNVARLYAMPAEGITFFGEGEQIYVVKDQVEKKNITSIITDKMTTSLVWCGDHWFYGTKSGLRRIVGDSVESIGTGLLKPEEDIVRVYPGPDNSCWAVLGSIQDIFGRDVVYSGILHYKDGEVQLYRSDHEAFTLTKVFQDSQGRDWLAGPRGIRLPEGGPASKFTISDGLAGNQVEVFTENGKGDIWLGTNGGINKYRNGLLTKITESDGLLNGQIKDLAVDNQDRLWIRSRHGVQVYTTREDIGPPIELRAVTQDNEVLPLDEDVVLPFRGNDLSFLVAAVNTRGDGDQTWFEYSLTGERERWTRRTRENVINLPGLKPDRYRISISAYNRDLAASETPVTYQFEILTPIWRRTWFVVGVVIFVLVAGYFFYRARVEQVRVLNELNTAQQLQMSLMPDAQPELPGFDIYGCCVPAQEVGGDYFDYLPLDEEGQKMGFTVMDVSGKSMQAAVISILTSGLVNSHASEDLCPAEILAKINVPLHRKSGRKMFVTGLLMSLDLKEKTLTWANAGHMEPVVIRDGAPLTLPEQSRKDLALGVMKRWQYSERRLSLKPGDLVFCYTDGINEATNAVGELYGDDRMVDVLRQQSGRSAKEVMDTLLADIDHFVGDAPQVDDMTAIAILVT